MKNLTLAKLFRIDGKIGGNKAVESKAEEK